MQMQINDICNNIAFDYKLTIQNIDYIVTGMPMIILINRQRLQRNMLSCDFNNDNAISNVARTSFLLEFKCFI